MRIREGLALTTAALVLASCSGKAEVAAPTVTETVTHTVTAPPTASEPPAETTVATTPTTAAASEAPFPIHDLGERFEFADSGLTVHEVEVSKSIATNDGRALQAAPGEDLVQIKMHYENLGTASVDLSCAGALDLYMTVYDTDQREIEPVFEAHRIPGNPGCNDSLLAGQESSWNQAYRMVEGGTPMAIEIVDTSTFDDVVVVNLTDVPLSFDG